MRGFSPLPMFGAGPGVGLKKAAITRIPYNTLISIVSAILISPTFAWSRNL